MRPQRGNITVFVAFRWLASRKYLIPPCRLLIPEFTTHLFGAHPVKLKSAPSLVHLGSGIVTVVLW